MSDSLPVRPSPFVYKTLVRAERMLYHAVGHSTGGSELDRMLAIHGLDNACEFLLRVIGDHLELESRGGKSLDFADFNSLAGETSKSLNSLYGYRLPYLSDLKRLHQVRNLVQHGALDPQGDIPRFVEIIRRFFNYVLHDVFGMEEGEVAASALIDDSEVKGHLVKAEGFLSRKEYLESVIASRDAFENAYYRKLVDSDVTLSLLPAIVLAKNHDEQYAWSMVTIKNELEFTRLGINTEDTRRFFEYIDYIPSERRCDGWARVLGREWTVDDALFCYSYASSIALKWQSSERDSIASTDWDPTEYSFSEILADIDLSNTFDGGCVYFDAPNTEMQFWYLDRDRKEQLENLEKNKEYAYERVSYKKGKLESKFGGIILLKGIFTELTTNNPERWKVIIWFDGREIQPIPASSLKDTSPSSSKKSD